MNLRTCLHASLWRNAKVDGRKIVRSKANPVPFELYWHRGERGQSVGGTHLA